MNWQLISSATIAKLISTDYAVFGRLLNT